MDDVMSINFPNLATRLVSSSAHVIGASILAFCIARRTAYENLGVLKGWKQLPFVRLLIILLFIDSWLFLTGTGVLVHGIGLERSATSCSLAIFACIFLYTSSKVLIYLFLTEKVWVVWSNNTRFVRTHRLHSPIYLACIASLVAYSICLGLMLAFRVADLNGDNRVCVIGLQKYASIPLLTFDVYITVLLTGLFIYPLLTDHAISNRLRRIALRTLIASFVALLTSTVNIAVLTSVHGKERGWVCLASCGADVTVNALVLYVITEGRRKRIDRPPRLGRKQAPASFPHYPEALFTAPLHAPSMTPRPLHSLPHTVPATDGTLSFDMPITPHSAAPLFHGSSFVNPLTAPLPVLFARPRPRDSSDVFDARTTIISLESEEYDVYLESDDGDDYTSVSYPRSHMSHYSPKLSEKMSYGYGAPLPSHYPVPNWEKRRASAPVVGGRHVPMHYAPYPPTMTSAMPYRAPFYPPSGFSLSHDNLREEREAEMLNVFDALRDALPNNGHEPTSTSFADTPPMNVDPDSLSFIHLDDEDDEPKAQSCDAGSSTSPAKMKTKSRWAFPPRIRKRGDAATPGLEEGWEDASLEALQQRPGFMKRHKIEKPSIRLFGKPAAGNVQPLSEVSTPEMEMTEKSSLELDAKVVEGGEQDGVYPRDEKPSLSSLSRTGPSAASQVHNNARDHIETHSGVVSPTRAPELGSNNPYAHLSSTPQSPPHSLHITLPPNPWSTKDSAQSSRPTHARSNTDPSVLSHQHPHPLDPNPP